MNRLIRILIVVGVTVFAALLVVVLTSRKPANLVRVNKAEARLQQAVRKAQAGLDAFILKLQKANPQSRFAVKGKFETDQGPEYLWVRDPAYRDGIFVGVLDQAPVAYRLHKKGDIVRLAKGQIVDTLILTNGEREGGYTDDALSGN